MLVVADIETLKELEKAIPTEFETFRKGMYDIISLKNQLAGCWDADKLGSFTEVMDEFKVILSKIRINFEDAQKKIIHIRELAEEYLKLKF